MRRLHLLVVGQTEEVIADAVFRPPLESLGGIVSVSILETKRLAGGGKHRGGVSQWPRIERELRRLLGSDFDVVTTMIDYYGFPADAPGMADRPPAGAREGVTHVERALADAIGDRRFLPNLVLHETEAWVFAAAGELATLVGEPSLADDLLKVVDGAGGAELINDSPETAPSKRLATRMPTYLKTLHGPLAIEALGLAALRSQCPRLDSWVSRLEQHVRS